MSRILTVSLFSLALGAACGSSDDDDDNNVDPDAGVDDTVSLSVTFEGLPDLGSDYVYEGWVLVDGAPVSTGRFSSTGIEAQTFDQSATAASDPTAYILTIEPAVGDDPAPADTHVVAGDISAGSANLTIGHAAALGDDFTSAAGSFILATPTSADAGDDNLGIWFLDPAGGPGPSLTLPTLPAGWVYEGWVVDGSGPVTTGRFTDPAVADSDGAGPTSEMPPAALPPFPGQDFITPPVDLTNGFTAVLTIEPEPDNGPEPFQLKPLIQPIDPLLVGGANPQTLANTIGQNTVTGSVTIQ